MANYNFADALEWASDNEVVIEIVREKGTYGVRASRGRISANYLIDMAEPDGFRGAVWAAITSVQTGTEFHSVHGFTPGLNTAESPNGIEGSGGSF